MTIAYIVASSLVFHAHLDESLVPSLLPRTKTQTLAIAVSINKKKLKQKFLSSLLSNLNMIILSKYYSAYYCYHLSAMMYDMHVLILYIWCLSALLTSVSMYNAVISSIIGREEIREM